MKGFDFLFAGLLYAALPCAADSIRCGTNLVQVGDTKAEVKAKCGEPASTDTFCRAVQNNAQNINITQGGNHNIQQNVIVQTCQNVDVWNYNQGAGSFLKILYFSEGKLIEVELGDRT